MTRYELLIENADECHSRAIATDNVNLKKFYLNAEEGYREKAAHLTVEEAHEVVE